MLDILSPFWAALSRLLRLSRTSIFLSQNSGNNYIPDKKIRKSLDDSNMMVGKLFLVTAVVSA